MGLLISTVMDEGEAGQESDYRVLALARRMGRTLVTSDKSFKLLHKRLLELNLSHAGIIYLSMKREPADLVAFIADVRRQAIEKDMPEMLYHTWWKV